MKPCATAVPVRLQPGATPRDQTRGTSSVGKAGTHQLTAHAVDKWTPAFRRGSADTQLTLGAPQIIARNPADNISIMGSVCPTIKRDNRHGLRSLQSR